jgi:hypothetical protein
VLTGIQKIREIRRPCMVHLSHLVEELSGLMNRQLAADCNDSLFDRD